MIMRINPREYFPWSSQDWLNWEEAEKINYYKKSLKFEPLDWCEEIDLRRTQAWALKSVTSATWHEARRWAFNNWLKVCLADDLDAKFYFATKELAGKKGTEKINLDPEQCVAEIITDGKRLDRYFTASGEGNVDTFGRQHLYALSRWYLRRHNLSMAWWILSQLRQAGAENYFSDRSEGSKNPEARRGLRKCLSVGIWTILLFFLLAILIFPNLINSKYLPAILVCSYAVLVIGFSAALIRYTHFIIYLLLPRMMACIIIGYLPLVIPLDSWRELAYLGSAADSGTLFPLPLRRTLITLGALFFSLGYLWLEVLKNIPSKRGALGRALKIFGIGLATSVLVGFISLDLLGNAVQAMDDSKMLCPTQLTWVPGLIGNIPLEPFPLFVSLAMLIGIFVQIIWEEKPITEPL